MKQKWLIIITVFTFVLTLSSCRNSNNTKPKDNTKNVIEKDTKAWFMNLVIEKGIDKITTDDLSHLPHVDVGGTLIIEYKLKDGNSIVIGGLYKNDPGFIYFMDKDNNKTVLKMARLETDWDSLKD